MKHFQREGFHRWTIVRSINRYQERGSAAYLPSPRKKWNPGTEKTIRRALTNILTSSVRRIATKLEISRFTVLKTKVRYLGIKARIRKCAARMINNQEFCEMSECRFVYEQQKHNILVIDDKSYVFLNPEEAPGRKFVNADNHTELSFEHKFKQKSKFIKKFLIWQAINEEGNISEPYLSTGRMNQHIYMKECLKKRLILFLKKHHRIEDVLFWPDLATCHYAQSIQKFLKTLKVGFLSKDKNPTKEHSVRK